MRAWMWALFVSVAMIAMQLGVSKATEHAAVLPKPAADEPLAAAKSEQTAVFDSGCFFLGHASRFPARQGRS